MHDTPSPRFVFRTSVASLAAALFIAGCTADNPDYIGERGFPSGSDGSTLSSDLGLPSSDLGHVSSDLAHTSSQPDLAPIPPPPYTPSHVSPDWFSRGAADLVIESDIDTSAFTVDGKPVPAGVAFAEEGGLAVLAAHGVSIPMGKKVRAHGSRPLVVIAADSIEIAGTLDGAGHLDEPGPGGAGTDAGPGAGHKGLGSGLDGGGSGAGYGGAGGRAGAVGGLFCGESDTAQNPGGGVFGDAKIAMLLGGSGGGSGNLGGKGCPAGVDSHGGAGGGAIQLSAGKNLHVSGTINAGGGGGKGGCKNPAQDDSGSGAGGGSGGAVLLEAPVVDVGGGFVAANGGGGGGGSFDTAGGNGTDGLASTMAAAGGAGGQNKTLLGSREQQDQRGGGGGTSGNGANSPDAKSSCGNSGGAGGGTGRVYVRSRDPVVKSGAVLSPAPTYDSLP